MNPGHAVMQDFDEYGPYQPYIDEDEFYTRSSFVTEDNGVTHKVQVSLFLMIPTLNDNNAFA